jgi:citrate lyase beta subunit
MPGDDRHKIEKAIGLGVDCICMDIEDGVALNRKQAARETIRAALETLDFGNAERLVRVNPLSSDLVGEDLQAILPGQPDGLVLPKVQDARQVQRISQVLSAFEQKSGLPEGQIVLLALIETARGVVNLKEIAQASPRLQALIFGAEDLAGDIGATRTRPGWEIFYARSAVVTHAAAFGLQAIDMVFMDLQDLDALAAECEQAAQMAYSGKQAIHPRQVEPIQTAFSPSPQAIEQAQRVVQAAAEQQQAGSGAFALDGRMIDAPVVRAAEWVLEKARAAGRIK